MPHDPARAAGDRTVPGASARALTPEEHAHGLSREPRPRAKRRASALACLLFVALSSCTPTKGEAPLPRKVLGVLLGGSVQDLETAYADRGVPLRRTEKETWSSPFALEAPEGLAVERIEYRGSGSVVDRIEVHLPAGSVSGLERLLDETYSYDEKGRREMEQRYRWIGTIGDNDHFWSLDGMGIVVTERDSGTRLIFSLRGH